MTLIYVLWYILFFPVKDNSCYKQCNCKLYNPLNKFLKYFEFCKHHSYACNIFEELKCVHSNIPLCDCVVNMSCPGFRRGHECSKGKEEYHNLLVEFIESNMHYVDKSNPNRIVYCFALEQNGEREPVILRIQSSYLLNKYENFTTFDHAISGYAN